MGRPAAGRSRVGQYSFKGESAHAAGAPWRGRSALDAVELMDVGWNFRREHLPPRQRSHYVIPDGGDQPNVVPPTASVWYYFRQRRSGHQGDVGDRRKVAQGAAMMTDTELLPTRVLGSAWPRHFNRAVAEADVRQHREGRPAAVERRRPDVRARGAKGNRHARDGWSTRVRQPGAGRSIRPTNTGGGSDDIGDISWNVPTVTLRYPSNIPGLPGHNWADGIAMATPIAHKGVTAGAKVQAMTIVDLLLKPEVVTAAWDYFRTCRRARRNTSR